MGLFRVVCFVLFVLFGLETAASLKDASQSTHRIHLHKAHRRHRAVNDGALHFESELYNKKLELGSSGKIHCKVAGGVSPTVQWFLNDQDSLPDGITSVNGTLLVSEASRSHTGQYTCKATDGDQSITAKINLDIVVSPRILEPVSGYQMHVEVDQIAVLVCRAIGDPPPKINWDRNLTKPVQEQPEVDVEGGSNSSNARILLLKNGTLLIRRAKLSDTDRYGCTAGSAAGLARSELVLTVHNKGTLPVQESSGVAGKAVVVSISVAGAYMVLVLALMLYCRRRRLRRRERGEKMELEMAEGREKLVEEGEEGKKIGNGAAVHNGRLLPHGTDSGNVVKPLSEKKLMK